MSVVFVQPGFPSKYLQSRYQLYILTLSLAGRGYLHSFRVTPHAAIHTSRPSIQQRLGGPRRSGLPANSYLPSALLRQLFSFLSYQVIIILCVETHQSHSLVRLGREVCLLPRCFSSHGAHLVPLARAIRWIRHHPFPDPSYPASRSAPTSAPSECFGAHLRKLVPFEAFYGAIQLQMFVHCQIRPQDIKLRADA